MTKQAPIDVLVRQLIVKEGTPPLVAVSQHDNHFLVQFDDVKLNQAQAKELETDLSQFAIAALARITDQHCSDDPDEVTRFSAKEMTLFIEKAGKAWKEIREEILASRKEGQ